MKYVIGNEKLAVIEDIHYMVPIEVETSPVEEFDEDSATFVKSQLERSYDKLIKLLSESLPSEVTHQLGVLRIGRSENQMVTIYGFDGTVPLMSYSISEANKIHEVVVDNVFLKDDYVNYVYEGGDPIDKNHISDTLDQLYPCTVNDCVRAIELENKCGNLELRTAVMMNMMGEGPKIKSARLDCGYKEHHYVLNGNKVESTLNNVMFNVDTVTKAGLVEFSKQFENEPCGTVEWLAQAQFNFFVSRYVNVTEERIRSEVIRTQLYRVLNGASYSTLTTYRGSYMLYIEEVNEIPCLVVDNSGVRIAEFNLGFLYEDLFIQFMKALRTYKENQRINMLLVNVVKQLASSEKE